jgi:opacity protein-like surface antigen
MENMRGILIPILAGTAIVAAGAMPANAADILYDPPPVYKYHPPEKKVVHGGWYLRGHIGMTNQRLRRLEHPDFAVVADHEWLDRGGFSSAPLFGGGVGYEFNDWLRGDITVEYRGKASFAATDRWVRADNGEFATNHYTAKKSELLLLANAYADLGNFHGFKPYVGAGIGMSRTTISHFADRDILRGAGGYAPPHSMWQLAWALHAGVGFQLTDRATLDFGYSYTHLGNARTGPLHNYDPREASLDPMTFRGLHSHDFKVGLRYALY